MANEPRTFSSDQAAEGAKVSPRTKGARPAPSGAELGVGVPNSVDPHAIGGEDRPEEAWGEAASDAYHGANHTRRPEPTEAKRGQGRRTVERNKAIVKGRLYER